MTANPWCWASRVLPVIAAITAAGVPARAGEFAEFRIPDHWVRTGAASLSASGSWSTRDQFGTYEDDSRFSSSVGANLGSTRDADDFAFGWTAGLSGGLRRDRSRSYQSDRVQSSELWQGDQRVNATVSGRLYPWRGSFGMGVSGSGFWEITEVSNDRATSFLGTNEVVRNEARGEAREALFSLQPGFGHVRDASVVYAVDLMEQRLRETGALDAPLSAGTRRRLAELLYAAPDFDAVHDRPQRFFWREFERLLREDGALASGTLDPYSLFRALEPLVGQDLLFRVNSFSVGTLASQFLRLRGYFAGAVVDVRHTYQFQSQDVTVEPPDDLPQHLDTTRHSDVVQVGGRLAFHRPLGWHWQAGGDTQLTVPVRPDEHGMFWATSAAVTWLIADRWRAESSFSHAREVFEPRHTDSLQRDTWRADWDADVRYYLEDRIAIQAGVQTRQSKEAHSGDGSTWRRETSVNLGVRYIFRGALDGPPGIEPQRLFRAPGAL